MNAAETAVAYHLLHNLHPVAIKPNSKIPMLSGWQDSQVQFTIDAIKSNPRANIGIVVPGGYIVLDVDTRNNGHNTLEELEAKHGKLPETLAATTSTGGKHKWFKLPEGVSVSNRAGLLPGLDIKAKGGYVVVPPSEINGNNYIWDNWDTISPLLIADIPQWLLELIRKRVSKTANVPLDAQLLIPEGRRNNELFERAASLRSKGFEQGEIESMLLSMNKRACKPPLPESEVSRIAASAAKYDRAATVEEIFNQIPSLPTGARLPNPTNALDRVELQQGSDLNIEPINWLWKDWLACGKLHILAGAPGTGKTTIALTLAATISIGGRWPDGTNAATGNTLMWSGEDDPSDTLLPRFIAQGGDRNRIYFVGDRHIGGQIMPFDPARDVTALISETEKLGNVKLIVVDPVVNAVAGDSHKNTEVRRALQPLVDMASRIGAAVLGITHFSKSTSGRDPVERVTGSIAFGALARIVLAAAKGESNQRLFVRSKSNIGPDGGGFEYYLSQIELENGISASQILWGGSVAGSARDLLGVTDEEHHTELEAASDWLRELLANGPVSSKEIKSQAENAGFSWATVRRAKDSLGIKPAKTQFDGGWSWSLPKMRKSPEGAQGFEVGSLDKDEQLECSKLPSESQDPQQKT